MRTANWGASHLLPRIHSSRFCPPRVLGTAARAPRRGCVNPTHSLSHVCREQTLLRSGTLIGTDQNGNKYYENRAYQVGRHRWAVFANPWDYSASSIPPGWHAWLCCIHDGAPSVHAYSRPFYELAPWDGRYGSSSHEGATALTPERDVHLPKGHVKKGGRSWARFQQWVPPAAAKAKE